MILKALPVAALAFATIFTASIRGAAAAAGVPQGNVSLPPAKCASPVATEVDTVQCASGATVAMLGIAGPTESDQGADWARSVANWFLEGRTATLEYDAKRTDGDIFQAYLHVTGADGENYNISALLIYIGVARFASDGVNMRHDAWLSAAEGWARSACWNMWDGDAPWAAESGCTEPGIINIESCSLVGQIKSSNGDATSIEFRNRTDGLIDIVWLGFDGAPVTYMHLGPGDSYVQPTFLTHPWAAIAVGTGACRGVYMPVPGYGVATVY